MANISHRQHVILQETMDDPNCKILLKILMEEGAYNPFSNGIESQSYELKHEKHKEIKKIEKTIQYKIENDTVTFYNNCHRIDVKVESLLLNRKNRKLGKWTMPTYFILSSECKKWISSNYELFLISSQTKV